MILFEKKVNLLLRVASDTVRTSWRRTGVAFIFSIVMHAVIVWLPQIHLPLAKVQVPPLSVKLEVLPAKETSPIVSTQSENNYELASRVNRPGIKSLNKVQFRAPSTMKKMEKSDNSNQFPKHLHLSFAVYSGAGNSRVGEEVHKLDVQSDRYTLKSLKQIARRVNFLGQEQFVQTSRGIIGEQGLHPEVYKEETITAGKNQDLIVNFDWESQTLHFSNAAAASLPTEAQDALSFMYQLSKVSMNKEIIPLAIVNATGVEKYEFEISRPEDIDLPAGKLRAVRLRKLHRKGEPYFEIWLGLEYRLLPVKFRKVDGNGEFIEESVISDIWVSDE